MLSAPAAPAPADFDDKYKDVNGPTPASTRRSPTTRPTSSWLRSTTATSTARTINEFIGSYTG